MNIKSYIYEKVDYLLLRFDSTRSILKSYCRGGGAGDSEPAFPNLKLDEFKASWK